ncbi:translation initiation factor IF-2 [Thermaurantimonas aggregans]|uniref:Translation initiation factor IF-2 n=1 Tax=Thermaurantimonas aggregans TaxID=2173829 RepID=A0A401XKZ3_9FLAO|nr:translation initiation factor IF-2 [Thermaurantimonas aggregans]MCX8148242.1 translation initiation factor IF-2 [Thermaurantimonas aggregans]GCD77668.1 translation initiation factor IF-2 [Thermaurantimonas aggregans]
MNSTKRRLSAVLEEFNIGFARAKEFLATKDIHVDSPNAKITEEVYELLLSKFSQDLIQKKKTESKIQQLKEDKEAMRLERELQLQKQQASETSTHKIKTEVPKIEGPKTIGKIELVTDKSKKTEPVKVKTETEQETIKKQSEETPAESVQKTIETIESTETLTAQKSVESSPQINLTESKTEPTKEKQEEAEKETPKINLTIVGKVDTVEKETSKKRTIQPEEETKELKQIEETTNVEQKPEEESQVEVKETSAPSESKPSESTGSHKIETKFEKIEGPKLTGEKIDLSKFEKKKEKDKPKKVIATNPQGQIIDKEDKKTKKRKRIVKDKTDQDKSSTQSTQIVPSQSDKKKFDKPSDKKDKNLKFQKKEPVEPIELSDEEISKQIKETLEKLTSNKKAKLNKIKKLKRDERREMMALNELQAEEDSKTLKVTEFVTVGEVANMMNVPVTKVIATCMSLGLMVTMNQRLDAETLSIVADEFGYKVQFVDAEMSTEELIEDEEDDEADLVKRPPIVTVMGHVDHGKTSLLDYIRKTNVIAGEAGGITQHIGAYSVEMPDGQHITFLDTPGHEAFTAMRARGAKITDVAIIVIAADDNVMPQTKEAIAHAQAAGVPIVFAINKIDKPNANPDKIKEQLANMNLLVEDWGGKIQSQEISAKTGQGVNELLEKVLLEAELLDLKANPNRRATGTVIEASLDKGRGYVSTVLVQNGTLKVGDIVLAGQYAGKVRALLDERGKNIKSAGPSMPAAMLGLDGAPAAGDKFVVMTDEKEAKQLASKRQQLQRELSARAHRKITLEEIGRRLALGDFKELNIILKCDVDGSVEALSDALSKLSTEKIQVRILHKGVGQITESDVLLAAASDAIVIGFNVRPSANARKIAERDQVEIRHYSIIYDAIDDVKAAMEGMLAPETKETIIANVEVRETFKISKVGTIAGCMVLDGTIKRGCKVRVIRDGVVVYTGELASLKRFKDDVKEVSKGYECGLSIKNFNDIKVGDIIEAYEETLVKQKI